MRKQVWILCVAALGFCLLLILLLPGRPRQATIAPQDQTTLTNHHHQSDQSKRAERYAVTPSPQRTPSSSATPPNSTATTATTTTPPPLSTWQAPIQFYGKVVDENSNPVEGARATFTWVETPAEDGNRTATTESDAQGLFSLEGAKGPNLGVSVSKPGYYTSRATADTFNYALANEIFRPDPRNPVVFMLRTKNKGETLIQTQFPAATGQMAQLRGDGTPFEIDLFTGQKASVGSGQLRLELWRAASPIGGTRFDWKCQISIPGGGIAKTGEEFAFQAPKEGYQQSYLTDMPATNLNWREDTRQKFYIQLPGGKYGVIDIDLLAYNGVFTVHASINPTGSPNLEPAETEPQSPQPPDSLPPGVKAVVPEFK